MYGNNHEKERSLKSIYDENHFTYKLFSLKIKHKRAIIIETFKIITKESPLYMHDLVAIKIIKINLDTIIEHNHQLSRIPGMDWILSNILL